MSRFVFRGLCLVLVLSSPACSRNAVQGIVRDTRGDPLPGVVVQVAGGDPQALSDARGHYRLTLPPGDVRLEFSKTGYAPAELAVYSRQRGVTAAGELRMWKLPMSPGVYLLEDFRYRQMSWVIPRQFYMADETVAYGTRSDPSPAILSSEPVIICYHTPRYDARLTRLVRAQATQAASKTGDFEVWTAGGTIVADLVPVDQPQGTLRRLRIDRPLEPGAYAVHWGALEGYTTLESRVYMFEVTDALTIDDVPVIESESDLEADAPGVDSE